MGVSRPIYVNVDSPNLGFPYYNFLGGTSEEKNTLYDNNDNNDYNDQEDHDNNSDNEDDENDWRAM